MAWGASVVRWGVQDGGARTSVITAGVCGTVSLREDAACGNGCDPEGGIASRGGTSSRDLAEGIACTGSAGVAGVEGEAYAGGENDGVDGACGGN